MASDQVHCTVGTIRHAGTTMTYRWALQVTALGSDKAVPITPELLAAIEAEELRQQQKKSSSGKVLPQTTNATPTQE